MFRPARYRLHRHPLPNGYCSSPWRRLSVDGRPYAPHHDVVAVAMAALPARCATMRTRAKVLPRHRVCCVCGARSMSATGCDARQPANAKPPFPVRRAAGTCESTQSRSNSSVAIHGPSASTHVLKGCACQPPAALCTSWRCVISMFDAEAGYWSRYRTHIIVQPPIRGRAHRAS